MLDAIIVGQGIAGTAISHRLLQRDKTILVIDKGHQNAASRVAAGLINPITGRKYVKSWMIDQLLEELTIFYKDVSNQIGYQVVDERPIIRALHTPEDENQWYGRLGQDGYDRYLVDPYDGPAFTDVLAETFSWGRIRHSMSIRSSELISRYRELLSAKNMLLEEAYDEDELQVYDDHVRYGDIAARCIIYCAGWRDSLSRYWSHLPWRPAKGEAMTVSMKDFPREHIVKHHKFIVPQDGDRFWIGGTYAWHTTDESPTADKRDELSGYISKYIKTDAEIVSHDAAIRPANKHRRPFIGRHPEHRPIYIFNGLGTKGFSLAPYWSKALIEHMYEDLPLSRDLPSLIVK